MRCAVLGAGSFGTALAMQLGRLDHEVGLWARSPELAAVMTTTRRNPRYLPEIELPPNVTVSSEIALVANDAQLVVVVVPSQAMRQVMTAGGSHLDDNAIVCSASKGIEQRSLCTMGEVLRQVLHPRLHQRICALSGPSFAKELAQDMPTAVVVAGRDEIATHRVASAFHGSCFRVYHSNDVVGVEVGGALKNVMAIGCGIADGMGLGLNARAAIITRGLAEITRLGVRMGAQAQTFQGLAGMGDLVLTCTGNLSRNRRVGLALGEGKTLQQAVDELGQVAEGVATARSAFELGGRLDVELPITEEVYRLLYEDKPAREALMSLLGRRRRAEQDDDALSK